MIIVSEQNDPSDDHYVVIIFFLHAILQVIGSLMLARYT